MAILFIMLIGCSRRVTTNFAKPNELERLIKTYEFIPFNIPRDGDGVGTLITFEKGKEAVIASVEECFDESKLNLKLLDGTIPNYDYTIEVSDTSSFSPGQIFGDYVTLNSALRGNKVKKIKVEFNGLFEQRVSRQSVENQLEGIKETNLACLKNLTNEKHFLIERVLGARELTITLQDEQDRTISLDSDILEEINVDSKYVRNLNGNNILTFSEPRFIGYRIWQIEAEGGMGAPEIEIKELTSEEILRMKN